VHATLFAPLSQSEAAALERAVERFGTFLGLRASVSTTAVA